MATLRKLLEALPEVSSVDDVALVFRVDRQTVWRWLRHGDLPGVRVGRTWRIFRDDLIEAFAPDTPSTLSGQAASAAQVADLQVGSAALETTPPRFGRTRASSAASAPAAVRGA